MTAAAHYGLSIFPQHAELLAASAVSPEVARARGYVSVDTKTRLQNLKIAKAGRNVPGLLIPIRGVDGTVRTHEYRPDCPRLDDKGKPKKYEKPYGSKNALDVPAPAREQLGDPSVPLWITEGARKADAAVSAGLCCVALLGVYGWRYTNEAGGKVPLACWESVALNGRDVYVAFDSDVMTKREVRKALDRLAAFLGSRQARVHLVYLPDTGDVGKVGLDDFLAAGGTVEQLRDLARPAGAKEEDTDSAPPPPRPSPPPAAPVDLAAALTVFKRWLHIDDDAPVLATAATVVANNADGDPAWLLLVGPPSSGKTETLQAAAALPYVHPAATVTEGALLSGVSRRDRDKDATGGLLRQVGEYGIILCKDFTSVLSQNKDVSASALAALREVYDGSWDRPVGAGGGRVLSWSGKCGLIGGVTPSIDRYAQVVGALGDRYVLLRLPDVDPASMARSALEQGGNQREMRAELSAAMRGLIAAANTAKVTRPLGDDERARLIALATFTARARTAVERDGYTREVLVLPQPEGTGRIVGQFRRLLGGLEAIGCDAPTAWTVLRRVAVDCVPRLRLAVMRTLLDAELHTYGLANMWARPDQLTTGTVAQAVGVDWRTANRHLEDLRLLDLAVLDIAEADGDAKPTYWHSASSWLRKHWPAPIGPDENYYYGSGEYEVPQQNPRSQSGTSSGTGASGTGTAATGTGTGASGTGTGTGAGTGQTPRSEPGASSGTEHPHMGGRTFPPDTTPCRDCGTPTAVGVGTSLTGLAPRCPDCRTKADSKINIMGDCQACGQPGLIRGSDGLCEQCQQSSGTGGTGHPDDAQARAETGGLAQDPCHPCQRPGERPRGTCEGCHQPMTIVEDGQTHHPNCQPWEW